LAADADAATAYYERLAADRFAALRATQSPWDPRLQHGGPPTALLAHAMLAAHPRDDMRLARITADFLGPIPLAEVEIVTRILRPGKRIELIEGTMTSGGREVVVARAWRMVIQPPGSIPPGRTPPDPVPQRAPAQEPPPWLRGWGYGESIEWRYATSPGSADAADPADAASRSGATAVWARPRGPLIAGEAIAELDRALIVVDSANGIGAQLPMATWLFVPPSLTVAIERYPRGEWILLEARSTLTDDGVGACVARLADDDGHFGHGLQSLFVARNA
jgi:hypothetical protein